ncbi:MAG TPA: FkbM family methyltransferase [Candidatus Binataceae bacterium]|nr:FkbM family methyltransferase [Candidatus Binataceae bacterium]
MGVIEHLKLQSGRLVHAIAHRIWPVARKPILQHLDRLDQRINRIEQRFNSNARDQNALRILDSNGLQLLLDPSSHVDRQIIETGNWEPQQLDYIMSTAYLLISRLDREAVFLDLGAYFGLYAMRMARSHLFSRIIAIEGDCRNYAQLRANIFINSLDRIVECVEAVLNECTAEMIFWRSEAHYLGNRGGVGLVSSHKNGITEKVNAIPVDDVISVSGMLIVAKIDVEGHELAVVRGMKGLIENNQVLLQIECFPDSIAHHAQFLPTLGLRQINRIEADSYWTNIPASLI